MDGTGGRRPPRDRGVQLGTLLVAVVSSAITIYLGAAIVLVAVRGRHHFSASERGIIACLTILAAWVAARSWTRFAANRRESD